MKSIFLVFSIFALAFIGFGQSAKNDKPNFDVADFNKKAEVAEWLVRYDTVAWKTSDVVMTQDKKDLARLGKEWFCFQDKAGVWHAVYGKYENDKFDVVFHFTMNDKSSVQRTDEKVDAEFLNVYARALITANNQVTAALKNAPHPLFNQYVKQNADKTFSVWILPAFQPDGLAVYGGEFVYTIDQTGNKITKDETYLQSGFRGFKTGAPREIWLNFREQEKPSLGAIFFVLYYKDYFTKIFIDNSKTTSSIVQTPDKNYIWVHVEKEQEAKTKNK
jgi:hypothetical protein